MTLDFFSDLYASVPLFVSATLALISFLCGFGIRHWLHARKFNRTNVAGLQMFRSYTHMHLVRVAEEGAFLFSKLLFVAALLLGLVSVTKALT